MVKHRYKVGDVVVWEECHAIRGRHGISSIDLGAQGRVTGLRNTQLGEPCYMVHFPKAAMDYHFYESMLGLETGPW